MTDSQRLEALIENSWVVCVYSDKHSTVFQGESMDLASDEDPRRAIDLAIAKVGWSIETGPIYINDATGERVTCKLKSPPSIQTESDRSDPVR